MNDERRRRYRRGIIQSLLILGGLVVVTFMFQRVPALHIVSVATATGLDDAYKPIDATQTYHPDDTFYVAVEMRGYRPSMDVSAVWRYGGQIIAETDLETEDSGSGFAGFTLRSDEPWPTGAYGVEIVLDEQVVADIDFEVVSE